MDKLIELFNTDKTHIEIDVVNQYENGKTVNKHDYTYTIHLLNNSDNDSLCAECVESFSQAEIDSVIDYFGSILISLVN